MKTLNLITLFAAFLLASCTKEDLSECAIDIRFKYDYNTARVDKFTTDIHKITLFVFNQEGECVGEYEDAGNFGPDYHMRLKLTPGMYDFVVWGELSSDMNINLGMNRLVKQQEEGRLNLLCRTTSNGERVETFPHDLYYGARKRIEVLAFGNEDVLISMIKDTKSIRTIFRGLPTSNPLTREENLICRITAMDGDYDFDNSLVGNRLLTYMPQGNIEISGSTFTLTENFVTLRLFENNSCKSQLTLEYRPENTNPIKILDLSLDNTNLTNMIIHEYPNVDLVRDDVFELIFDYKGDYTFSNYTIDVNGWIVARRGTIIVG